MKEEKEPSGEFVFNEHLTMTEPEPEFQNRVKRNPNSCNSEPEVEAHELEKQYSFFL